MPDYTWIQTVLEKWGAKNKAYDSDVDGVFDTGAIPDLDASKITSGVLDLARIPTIPRSKLEYPTENVSFAYLASINKTINDAITCKIVALVLTSDNFTDKGVEASLASYNPASYIVGRFVSRGDMYAQYLFAGASTSDHRICKFESDSVTDLAQESVDATVGLFKFVITGSTLKGFREDMSTPKITATDTTFASGKFGTGNRAYDYPAASSCYGAYLRPVSTHLPKPLAIIEIDQLKQNLVEISQIDNAPDFLKENVKKYKILRSKGFTDEEIKTLFGDIQTHVDLASVTWGAFDHKPEHNTMLITITAGNPYTGEKAIQEQIEHAKSKGFKVLSPPRDYSEAIELYKQLKQEFTEWMAGKDNFAYQTLGHKDFEAMQVADTYYGNIVDGIKPDAYKDVPDWEMRRTLAMWKERLKRATIVKSETEKHLKKLEEVEKKGW